VKKSKAMVVMEMTGRDGFPEVGVGGGCWGEGKPVDGERRSLTHYDIWIITSDTIDLIDLISCLL
jgi:hypothetical protein